MSLAVSMLGQVRDLGRASARRELGARLGAAGEAQRSCPLPLTLREA